MGGKEDTRKARIALFHGQWTAPTFDNVPIIICASSIEGLNSAPAAAAAQTVRPWRHPRKRRGPSPTSKGQVSARSIAAPSELRLPVERIDAYQ